ncbi:MAG TPA: alanine--tRNA ligase [Verrucomicrobiae bacterium]|nr:alanine--tRNA ligase [Verrucomicrobiae bacterium]
MTGNEIRATFLKFFKKNGHRIVPSSSLVPHGDPTLLFTNAGMNQFKDVFLGLEQRDYKRATTAQKCVRAGGKHNDLENVGFTKRHHTFFEMMGNFSFGDYFKKEAVALAWELVTSPDWFALDKSKLYITVFGGAEIAPGTSLGVDEEAKSFWLGQNVPSERIVAVPGLKENFWAMGDTGPCGPCSEIHYDMGAIASDEGHADCKFPCDCGRYVEIWNLVFMQFNRDSSGKVVPLPKPSIDTGAGLERLAAVIQGKLSNFDTDLFQPLIQKAAELTGTRYHKNPDSDASLRIIGDHSRAATFLVSDGVVPSNEGRGYVLRKIIRRALRHANLLQAAASVPVTVLPAMAEAVKLEMGAAYPGLEENFTRVQQILLGEEQRFSRTITIGLKKFAEFTGDGTQAAAHDTKSASLSGEKAFMLYDTYGLPRDFLEDLARDSGITVEWSAFERAMQEQRTRARASWKGTSKESVNPAYAKIADTFKTEPCFYFSTTSKDCRIEAIITKSGSVNELKAGESGEVVLDRTSIYAESGGQMADIGGFFDNSGTHRLADVSGAFYPVGGLVAHRVTAKESLHVGDRVTVVADALRRTHIMRNHSGTHLVNAALRNILGTHVKQAGSLNSPERLRFDFTHFASVDPQELRDIEQQVNDEIRVNTAIETNVTSLEEALSSGALAFFGDKYPEHNVRVVTIPDPHAPRGFYSKELCGGTHVHRIGDVGVLKIIGEQSVAAGVRRIEAVTGTGALEHYQNQARLLSQLASQLNVGEDALLSTVEKLSQTAKQLEKELESQKRKGALGQLDELAAKTQLIKGVKVLAAEVANVDRDGLRQLVDSLRQKLGSGVIALGMPDGDKVALIVAVTKDLTAKVHAGKLIQALAKQVGGSGGGRPDLAEAGGKDTSALNSTLGSIPSLLEPLL